QGRLVAERAARFPRKDRTADVSSAAERAVVDRLRRGRQGDVQRHAHAELQRAALQPRPRRSHARRRVDARTLSAMHPPVFSDLSFDDALAKSKDQKKIFLVDATASWCQPCQHMDRTTWVDGNVIAAIGERAIAIQFDVDEHQELAKKLSVRAMPTVIAFKGGEEIDRITGVRAPAAFVAWLEGLG